MDNRIMHNPHLEAIPDHTGPHYQVLRDALVQNGMPMDQAIQVLDNSWTIDRDARILAWDQQVADDAKVAQQQVPQQQAPEDPVPQALPVPEEDTGDAEKKKPKMKDFDDATTIGNYIAPKASPIRPLSD